MNIILKKEPSHDSRLFLIKQEEVIVQMDPTITLAQAKRKAEKLYISMIINNLYGPEEEIQYDEHGKPHLVRSSDHISISHSGPLFALIANSGKPVGIDLQFPTEKLFRIREKYLSQEELNFCQNDLHLHLLCWSAKECMYKMNGKTGVSLRTDMDILPFKLGPSGIIQGKLRTSSAEMNVEMTYSFIDEYALVHTL